MPKRHGSNSKRFFRSKAFSLLITFLIVLSLILFAPASVWAVDVSIQRDKPAYNYPPVIFDISVIINTNELVPIDNLTLNLSTSGPPPVTKVITFSPDGTPISTDGENVMIQPLPVESGYWGSGYGTGYGFQAYNYGYRYGYDTGYGYGYYFGYGYGYGYSGYQTQLRYRVYWYFDNNVPDGDYTATLYVNASGGGTQHSFTGQTTFKIDRVPPEIVAVVARTRDNKPAYRDTNMFYCFENDNVYIVVKTNETGLTVWANFENITGDNYVVGVPMAENSSRYLITENIGSFDNIGGFGIPVVAMDSAGNWSASHFIIVTNINPKENASLGLNSDNTTDFRTINDFTNVEGLTFERVIDSAPVGRLRFLENIDLCDMNTVNGLINLGNNLDIAFAKMSLNTAAGALAAMNKKSELTMIKGLENFTEMPGIMKDGVPVLLSGAENNENVPYFSWDNANKKLVFWVKGWSTYEADGIPPTITSVSVSGITSSSANITWVTDENATSVVEYGTTSAYGLTRSDNALVKSHSITLTGLSANTTYYFRVKSKDAVGIENASVGMTFKTLSAPVTLPPEVVVRETQVRIDNITPGAPGRVEVQNLPITDLEISVNNAVSNVRITIQQSTTQPAEIAIGAPGATYAYLNIITENITDADIDHVWIGFRVEKSWIASEGIDESTIALYRYTAGEWTRLPTERVREDATYVYFRSRSPGLSVFAVSGSKVVVVAEFVVSNLSVTPAKVEPGQAVTISVAVKNVGNTSGTYTVTLKINDGVEATQSVFLAAGETRVVSFTTTKFKEGIYLVEVDGQRGSFTVSAPPAPVVPPAPITPAPSPAPPIEAIIVISVAAAAIIIVLMWMLVPKPSAKAPKVPEVRKKSGKE